MRLRPHTINSSGVLTSKPNGKEGQIVSLSLPLIAELSTVEAWQCFRCHGALRSAPVERSSARSPNSSCHDVIYVGCRHAYRGAQEINDLFPYESPHSSPGPASTWSLSIYFMLSPVSSSPCFGYSSLESSAQSRELKTCSQQCQAVDRTDELRR